MSNSPRFAFDVVACAVLGITLWAACAGIGFRIFPQPLPAQSDDEPASWRQPGVAACVGLGLLVMLGGIAVILRVPWWLVTVPFVVIGLALAARDVIGVDFRGMTRSALVLGGVAIAALGLVAVTEAIVGFRFPLHPWDDLRAYLPMAHRLIDTNTIIEPWSARRLQSLGGYTFLQAAPVAVFGHLGVGVIETMLASIFLGGLFVANGFRSTWARVLSIVLILTIPLLWVPRINTTGVLLGSPLLVAVLAVTAELRRALRSGSRAAAIRWAVAGGLAVATLMSVRPNLGLLAAAYVVVGALASTGTRVLIRIQVVVAAGASALVAVVPWSIASWQATRTPFYPLFTGNQNLQAERLPAARGAVDLADQAFGLLRGGPYPWIALAVLVIAFAARKLLPDAPFVLIVAVVTGLGIVLIALQGYSMSRIAFVRYTSPMSAALTVFLVYETIRGADARARADVAGRLGWAPVLLVTAAICVAAIGYSGLGLSLEYVTAPGGANLVDQAVRDELDPPPAFEVTTPTLRSTYRQALARVDPDRTIAAVDRPYLIDYRRFDIPSMDLPGFTAPGGDFPFFTGPGPKVARLRRAGYDTLLATVPANEIALNPYVLRQIASAGLKAYSRPARYYLDWENDVAEIARKAPGAVHRYGTVLVIDLARAQRQLSGA